MSSVICITFGENCAANVTVMILVVIFALRNLVTADFTNVILDLAVFASCKSKTANVTFVVSGINVSAIGYCIVADVALVVIVVIFAFGKSLAASITFVIVRIFVSTLGKSLAASIALVVSGINVSAIALFCDCDSIDIVVSNNSDCANAINYCDSEVIGVVGVRFNRYVCTLKYVKGDDSTCVNLYPTAIVVCKLTVCSINFKTFVNAGVTLEVYTCLGKVDSCCFVVNDCVLNCDSLEVVVSGSSDCANTINYFNGEVSGVIVICYGNLRAIKHVKSDNSTG